MTHALGIAPCNIKAAITSGQTKRGGSSIGVELALMTAVQLVMRHFLRGHFPWIRVLTRQCSPRLVSLSVRCQSARAEMIPAPGSRVFNYTSRIGNAHGGGVRAPYRSTLGGRDDGSAPCSLFASAGNCGGSRADSAS